MRRAQIDSDQINNWDTFHEVFAVTFAFPSYYGKNLNAWIDCMSDEIENNIVLLDITHAEKFKQRLPEIYDALVECSCFVNNRYTDHDDSRLYLGFIG